jgi:hypothetical protein
MNKLFTWYVNRGIAIAAAMVIVGFIDLLRAYWRRDLFDAIVVIIIFFIVGPGVTLWLHRTVSTGPEARKQ